MKRAITLVLLSMVLLATAVTCTPPATASDYARQDIAWVNATRAKHGLPPLELSGYLTGVATKWATHMATTGEFEHNFGAAHKLEAAGWDAWENVGYGPNLPIIEQHLMDSPTHRDNILRSGITSIGVGAVMHDGRLWLVEDFGVQPHKAVAVKPKPKPVVTHAPKAVATTKGCGD